MAAVSEAALIKQAIRVGAPLRAVFLVDGQAVHHPIRRGSGLDRWLARYSADALVGVYDAAASARMIAEDLAWMRAHAGRAAA